MLRKGSHCWAGWACAELNFDFAGAHGEPGLCQGWACRAGFAGEWGPAAFPGSFPSLRGCRFCWEQDGASRLPQGCSAEPSLGLWDPSTDWDNSPAQQLLPAAAWGWGLPWTGDFSPDSAPDVAPCLPLQRCWDAGRVQDAAQPMEQAPTDHRKVTEIETLTYTHISIVFLCTGPSIPLAAIRILIIPEWRLNFWFCAYFSFSSILTSHFSLGPGLVSLFKDDDT